MGSSPPNQSTFLKVTDVKNLLVILILAAVMLISQAGSGFAEDDEEMTKLKELCEKGNDTACFRIGEKYRIIERDNKSALTYYLKACETDHYDACTYAGILTSMQGKQSSPAWKKAAILFEKSCTAKQEMGCFNLGSLKYKEGRQKAAIKYFKIACDLGHPTGCDNVKSLER
jgi:TPR repeat protein